MWCRACKHHAGLKCELHPDWIVVSPERTACECFEPKEEAVAGETVESREAGGETLPSTVKEEWAEPILPSKPLRYWQVGELDIYLLKKPPVLVGYKRGEEAFTIKLKALNHKEAARQLRDNALKAAPLSEDEAEKLLQVCREVEELLAKKPKVKKVPLERVVNEGKVSVSICLVIKERDGSHEAWLQRRRGKAIVEKQVAFLPEIVLLHDAATGNAFFLAKAEGRVVAVSPDLEGLLRQLIVQGYITKPSLSDINLQLVLREIVKREEGELAPGLGLNGFVDPLGVGLDLNHYGVEGLLAVKEWVERYYPESNRKTALATVALTVAKLVSPTVRKLNPTFIDSVVWNYGRGGEGKTTLLAHAVLPLLSIKPGDEKALVFIRGAVETSAQMAFLITINRLPLILDEQTLKALERNADILLSAVVGQGIIKIHAPRYGLLGEVRFKNLRGLVVATNVEFSRWLRRVREHASDIAFARRVLEVEWENESLKPEAFENLPQVKPVLGAVERVWKYKFKDLAKSRDIAELAEKLFVFLGDMYKVDLSAYVEAVREVRSRWEATKSGFKFADVDIVRERAYEIARQVLGASSLTGAKVLLSILENPDAFGVRLMRPKDQKVAVAESRQLSELAAKLAPFENTKQLADRLSQLAADNVTRIILKAGGSLVPGSPRVFLGAERHEYRFEGGGYANGYSVPISRFAEIFLLSAIEEEAQGSQNSGPNGPNDDEPPPTQSRNVQ